MRQLLLSVFAIIVLISCSSDEGNQFDSQLKIASIRFVPDEDTDGARYKTTHKLVDGEITYQNFTMQKALPTDSNPRIMSVTIAYPSSGNASGTYPFNLFINNGAYGFFEYPTIGFTIDTGSITVTDMGFGNYRLFFNDVAASHYLGELSNRSVTGYCQGYFSEIHSEPIPID